MAHTKQPDNCSHVNLLLFITICETTSSGYTQTTPWLVHDCLSIDRRLQTYSHSLTLPRRTRPTVGRRRRRRCCCWLTILCCCEFYRENAPVSGVVSSHDLSPPTIADPGNMDRDMWTDRRTDGRTARHRNTATRHRYRLTLTDRQTHRQTDGQTYRQTDTLLEDTDSGLSAPTILNLN